MGVEKMFEDPRQQALLGLSTGLLQAAGPSARPVSLGQALGSAMQGAMSNYQNALNAQAQRDMQGAQLAHLALVDEGLGLENKGKKSAFDQAEKIKQALIDYRKGQTSTQNKQSSSGNMMDYISQNAPESRFMPILPSGKMNPSSIPQTSGQSVGAQNQMLTKMGMTQQRAQELLDQADFFESRGLPAEDLRKQAMDIMSKSPTASMDFKVGIDPETGKPANYILYSDGTRVKADVGVAPKYRELSLGDRIKVVDENTLSPETDYRMGVNPSTSAQNALGWARLNFDKQQAQEAAAPSEAMFDPQTLAQMAQQYRAGDTSVFVGLGRGAQGAKNIAALRAEIAKQNAASGMGGADQAAINAQYFGTKAGQRAAGTRIANVEMASEEASNLIPLARQSSELVARSGFLPFGKAEMMFNNQTNDPAMRQFVAANNSLVNVYARAISPYGVPTVSDKEHAREMLSTAYDNKSYNAVLDQMQKEIDAARAAPKAVRKAFNEEVRSSTATESKAQAPTEKTATLADITATAKASGRSTKEVTAALRAKGYRIAGE